MAAIYNFNPTTIVVVPLISISLAVLLWKVYKRVVYTHVGVVRNLYFYPVKSLRRIEVHTLECTPTGVKANGLLDRSFMLVSGDHVLLSQRQEPKLTLLTIDVTDNHIIITNLENEALKLNIVSPDNKFDNVITCRIHDTEVETIDCGDAAAKFFNDFLGRKDVRLVRYASDLPKRRYIGKEIIFNKLTKKNASTFQDLAPVNLLAESSVNALNERLDENFSANNFRTNIYVTDSLSFDEDNWGCIKFQSGAVIEALLPCGRCVMITNDPETGIKTNKEPLATLRKFRMLEESKSPDAKAIRSPCFAVNCWVRKSGFVTVGDTVSAVIEKDRLIFKDEKE